MQKSDLANLVLKLMQDRLQLRTRSYKLKSEIAELRKELFSTAKEIREIDNEVDRHLLK